MDKALHRSSSGTSTISSRLKSLKDERGPERLEMEERAREEGFDAMSSDVSEGNRSERDRQYAQFKRTMQRPKDSAERIIAEDWAKAVKSKSRAQQTKMFKLWYSVAGDSKRMVAKWRLSSEDSTWQTDSHAWVTRGQLVKHYKNEEVADEIIAKKKASNLWKPHPEAPDLESARLYFCLYEMKSGETRKTASAKSVEGTSHIDPAKDKEAVDSMLAGISDCVGGDAAKGSDEEAEEKPGKLKTKKTQKTKKGKGQTALNGPPETESEKDDDPKDLLDSWMSTIMKDVQSARKIHLGLKQMPTQRSQAEALLAEAKKFEEYWSRLNKMTTDAASAWAHIVRRVHDEIGDFRKQIKVSKGALAGVDDKKKKKKKTDGSSSKSSRASSRK